MDIRLGGNSFFTFVLKPSEIQLEFWNDINNTIWLLHVSLCFSVIININQCERTLLCELSDAHLFIQSTVFLY